MTMSDSAWWNLGEGSEKLERSVVLLGLLLPPSTSCTRPVGLQFRADIVPIPTECCALMPLHHFRFFGDIS